MGIGMGYCMRLRSRPASRARVEGDSALVSGRGRDDNSPLPLPVCIVIFNNDASIAATDVKSVSADRADGVLKGSRYDK